MSTGMAVAIGAVLIALFAGWMVLARLGDHRSEGGDAVHVVPGGQGAMPVPSRGGMPGSAMPPAPAPANAPLDHDRIVAAVTRRFPMIREARVECGASCRLIMALGDQNRGPSPFDGALERYLTGQGYTLAGELVIDQPGDNDTLLTIPLAMSMPGKVIPPRQGQDPSM